MKASKSLKVKAIVAVMVLAITPVIAQQQWGPVDRVAQEAPEDEAIWAKCALAEHKARLE